MKEFAIEYKMTIDDLMYINRVTMDIKSKRFRTICLVMTFVWAVSFIIIEEYILSLFSIVFVILGAVSPYLIKLEVKMKAKNSFMLEKHTRLEFYEDHFVEKVTSPDEWGYCCENHIPYEQIVNVTDMKKMFLFFISPIEAIGIPLSAITEEEMIKVYAVLNMKLSSKYIDARNLDKSK